MEKKVFAPFWTLFSLGRFVEFCRFLLLPPTIDGSAHQNLPSVQQFPKKWGSLSLVLEVWCQLQGSTALNGLELWKKGYLVWVDMPQAGRRKGFSKHAQAWQGRGIFDFLQLLIE
jgi:hypothetical protein